MMIGLSGALLTSLLKSKSTIRANFANTWPVVSLVVGLVFNGVKVSLHTLVKFNADGAGEGGVAS